ncbi:MAG: O-acetylhomoserine aminocarboxypropyltransferase/cysteine synthase family protein [Akkermansia sp.]
MNTPENIPSLETILLHGGFEGDPETGSRNLPIYQTTAYNFESSAHAAALFSVEQFGNIYTRLMNPTTDVLERRLALMHGGTAALAVSSGQSAILLAVMNLTSAGQNIVASSSIYGGTYNLFNTTLRRFGVEVRFVDSSSPAHFDVAVDANTRLIYAESLGNPKNNVDDFEGIAKIAHKHNIPYILDNTVSPPPMFNPFEHGADIVVYSLTKFIDGHGNSMGGAIVENGKFNWNNGKYPELVDPDESYHGVQYWQTFGNHDQAAFPGMAYCLKARLQLLRDLGCTISPFNSYLIAQGLETLPLRMARHCENAMELAQWLEKHPLVSWVNYPGLPQHPDHDKAVKYLKNGFGGMVGFGIKGGLDAGRRFIDNVKLLSHVANLGDTHTLVTHPASTTHQQLSVEQLASTGVTPDFIRLSVGLENIKDIKADIDQALQKSQS